MYSKVTLEQISKEIGISRTTIYKVINDRGVVSNETKKKVLNALKQFNYVPNYNARDLAKSKRYQIAYIGMRHLSAKYFSILVNEGLKQAYNDFVDHGLEILIEESDFDKPEQQLKSINRMQKNGIKNFIISPSDQNLLKDKIDELQRNECNVILLSRCIDLPLRTYVGVDYYKSGMLIGEMLTKVMPAGGRIVILTNSKIDNDTTVKGRYSGFIDWIKKCPTMEVVDTIQDINTDEQACEVFELLRERYNNFEDIDAIYDITYKLSIIAEKATELGLEKKLKLVGFDIYPEIIRYIKSSCVDFVIGQQLIEQSYSAVKMMFQKICYGMAYEEKDYYSKLEIIVSSNLEYFT